MFLHREIPEARRLVYLELVDGTNQRFDVWTALVFDDRCLGIFTCVYKYPREPDQTVGCGVLANQDWILDDCVGSNVDDDRGAAIGQVVIGEYVNAGLHNGTDQVFKFGSVGVNA